MTDLPYKLSIDPIIYSYKSFIEPSICHHIIDVAKDKMKKAEVSGDKKGFISLGRTNKNCWIPHEYDQIFKNLSLSISNLLKQEISTAENFQIIHYSKGQEYKPHFDSWLIDGSEKSSRVLKYGGPRIYTALCYLNNIEEGGETIFPKVPLEIKPEEGKLIIFKNTIGKTNNRDKRSLHGSLPVVKGSKWAFNLWFREQNRRELFDYTI